jgi:amino acid transporter
MRRDFSAVGLLLLIVNGTIGSAWLFAPYYSAKIAGHYAIIAWLIGGLMTITIALAFAETSARIPLAGGTTEVAEHTHGGLTAFSVSWIAWLSNITMPPIEVQAVLQYASKYIPALTHTVHGTAVLTGIGFISAILLMIFLTALNILSLKNIVRSNFLILVFKLVTIGLTIFAIMNTQFIGANFMSVGQPLLSASVWKGILAAVATGGIAFAFTGFKHGVELAGESKNPQLTVPLAIIGSTLLCLLLYLGLQVAFIGSLDEKALLHGWSNLSFTGDVGPFAGIAAGLGLFWLARLLMVDAVISPLGAGSVYISSNARIAYAMSTKGYFPQWLSYLNHKSLPINAIFFNSFVGILLFLPLPSWQNMVSFLVSIMVISYAMGPIAMMSMRKSSAVQTAGFSLPGAKFLGLLGFYFCNLISYWTGWDTMSKFMIALLIGAIVFIFAFFRMTVEEKSKMKYRSAIWLIGYFFGLILISYLGSFNGKGIIPFGWDFLVIALFSIGIFYWAIRSRQNIL